MYVCIDIILSNTQVNAPTCPVIVVGTHLDRVDPRKASSLKQLVDTLYGEMTNIATTACVSSGSSTIQFKRNNSLSILRKKIYFVATHLFLNLKHDKGTISTKLTLDVVL